MSGALFFDTWNYVDTRSLDLRGDNVTEQQVETLLRLYGLEGTVKSVDSSEIAHRVNTAEIATDPADGRALRL